MLLHIDIKFKSYAGSKGSLTPQTSEDLEWWLPRSSSIGSALNNSGRNGARTPHNGGRSPFRRARRQLAFALLAAAAMWLLLTGIYMGSFIRTPVGLTWSCHSDMPCLGAQLYSALMTTHSLSQLDIVLTDGCETCMHVTFCCLQAIKYQRLWGADAAAGCGGGLRRACQLRCQSGGGPGLVHGDCRGARRSAATDPGPAEPEGTDAELQLCS